MEQKSHFKEIPFWLISVIFLVLTAIFFNQQLFGGKFFLDDFIENMYPTQNFAAKSSGIPFWTPNVFYGMPFLTDPLVGFFYPLNRILSLFMTNNGNLSPFAFQCVIILHYLIAQFSFYYLARTYKLSQYASILGAVSYAFSSMLVFHAFHPMMVYNLAWFPLIVAFLYKCIKTPKYKYAIIGGLIAGVSLLGGHPQVTLYEYLFLGLMFLTYYIFGIKNKEIAGKNLYKVPVLSLLLVVISVGIYCVQYLPSQKNAEYTQRSEKNYEYLSAGSMEYKQLASAVNQKIFGYVSGASKADVIFHLDGKIDEANKKVDVAPSYMYWETGFYFGLFALALGLFSFSFKNYEKGFLSAMAVFAVLYGVGSNGFVFPIFYNFPLFGLFRNPMRIAFYLALAFSLLAGMGFDKLTSGELLKNEKMKLWISLGLPVFASLLLAFGILSSMLGSTEFLSSVMQGREAEKALSALKKLGWESFAISAMVLVAVFFAVKGKIKALPLFGIIAILCFVDMFMNNGDFNVSSVNANKEYALRNPEWNKSLSPKVPDDIFRVNMRTYKPAAMAMKRNQGLVDNIMLAEGYNAMLLDKVATDMGDLERTNDLFNVKYAFIPQMDAFKQRTTYFDRARFVYSAIKASESDIKDKMKDTTINLKNTALIEGELKNNLSGKAVDSVEHSVKCLKYENNYFSYKVNSKENGILVFSEIYYPEWKAYIDGAPAEILRTDYSLRGVEVAAGEHTVEMRFESASFKLGSWITISTLILCCVGLVITFKYERD